MGWKLEARSSLELTLRAVYSWGGDTKVSPDPYSGARKEQVRGHKCLQKPDWSEQLMNE